MLYGRSSLLFWILSSLLLVFGCATCLFQWHSERSAIQSLLREVTGAMHQVEQQLVLTNLQLKAFGEALHRKDSNLQGLLGKLTAASTPAATPPEEAKELASNPSEEQTARNEKSLPDLPDGLAPIYMMTLELDAILTDPRFNLPKMELSRLQNAKLQAHIAAARAQIAAVDGQEKIALAEAMEELRSDGAFIDYYQGESYKVEPGVLTAGEDVDGRIRMYYMYPDQFPEIYEKRQAKAKIAEDASRQLLAMLKQAAGQ